MRCWPEPLLLVSRLAHLLMYIHRIVIHCLEYVVNVGIAVLCVALDLKRILELLLAYNGNAQASAQFRRRVEFTLPPRQKRPTLRVASTLESFDLILARVITM